MPALLTGAGADCRNTAALTPDADVVTFGSSSMPGAPIPGWIGCDHSSLPSPAATAMAFSPSLSLAYTRATPSATTGCAIGSTCRSHVEAVLVELRSRALGVETSTPLAEEQP